MTPAQEISQLLAAHDRTGTAAPRGRELTPGGAWAVDPHLLLHLLTRTQEICELCHQRAYRHDPQTGHGPAGCLDQGAYEFLRRPGVRVIKWIRRSSTDAHEMIVHFTCGCWAGSRSAHFDYTCTQHRAEGAAGSGA